MFYFNYLNQYFLFKTHCIYQYLTEFLLLNHVQTAGWKDVATRAGGVGHFVSKFRV